jgi:putative SOS response-associated peptidase YedK
MASTHIIVCDVSERVAPLHSRMPVILEPAASDTWLDAAAVRYGFRDHPA